MLANSYRCDEQEEASLHLFLFDGELLAGRALILTTNEVGHLFILGLFDGRFIILGSLTQKVFLYVIDAFQDGGFDGGKSFVQLIFSTKGKRLAPLLFTITSSGPNREEARGRIRKRSTTPLSNPSSFFSLSGPPPAAELSLLLNPPRNPPAPPLCCCVGSPCVVVVDVVAVALLVGFSWAPLLPPPRTDLSASMIEEEILGTR